MKDRYEIHSCENLPAETVQVLKDLDGEYSGWTLHVFREASFVDLEENHYLQEEGELIWNTVVAIDCCPYCGEQLNQEKSNLKQSSCYKQHFDYSGYEVELY